MKFFTRIIGNLILKWAVKHLNYNNMKIKMISLLMLLLSGAMTLSAQQIIEKFEVSGNCNMCKARIEKAAGSVEGITFARWDHITKITKVKFDSTKTDVKQIQLAIVEAGHDTEMYKATDKAYKKLPECCKYER